LLIAAFEPPDVGFAVFGHLPKDRRCLIVGDQFGEAAALRDAGANVGDYIIRHRRQP